jgi:hypothetical protein
MIYSYKVKRRNLTDTEKLCLKGKSEVISPCLPEN